MGQHTLRHIPIPPLLKKRPRYGQLPVPFMAPTDRVTGKPIFGFDDMVKKMDVVERRVCGQCGNSLDKVMAFIGDEQGCERGIFREPAMHLPCAKYALQVCPYFSKDQHQQTKVPNGPGVIIINVADTKLPPAKIWGIYLTRSFATATVSDGIVFRAGEQVGTTIWYAHGQEVKRAR